MTAHTTSPGLLRQRAVVWSPLWDGRRMGQGLEHILLSPQAADSVLLGFDDEGQPYRLSYTLGWDARWRLQTARLAVTTAAGTRTLQLDTNGDGRWRDAGGEDLPALAGCTDLDLWPTPMTNTLAIRRLGLGVQERREIRVVYIAAPALTVTVMRQAYTRLAERRYHYESLESGYQVELPVDADGVLLDYPGVFRRLG